MRYPNSTSIRGFSRHLVFMLFAGLAVSQATARDCDGFQAPDSAWLDYGIRDQLDTGTSPFIAFYPMLWHASQQTSGSIPDTTFERLSRLWWDRLFTDHEIFSTKDGSGRITSANRNQYDRYYATKSTLLAISHECYIGSIGDGNYQNAALRPYPFKSRALPPGSRYDANGHTIGSRNRTRNRNPVILFAR